MEKRLTIAVDGWSSCGKSTLARDLANALNYIYVDSGAMYRAITLYAFRNNLIGENVFDTTGIIKSLPNIEVGFEPQTDGNSNVLLNGEDVEKEIRNLTVSNAVSSIAKIQEVRTHLVKQQRKLGENGGVVMDGRDIGSVVFPNADLKIFLTAEPKVRAERRYKELIAKGENPTFEEVMENLLLRDQMDANREISPLIQTEDAIVIDNTHLNLEEQLVKALELVKDAQKRIHF